LESVAELYARKVAQLIGRWQAGADEPGDTEVINWLSQHDLLPRAPRLTELRDKMNPLRKGVPAPLHVMALADGDGEDERIHIRGSHKNLGATAPRHLLVAIAGEDQPAAT
jgi:hypothetical protein